MLFISSRQKRAPSLGWRPYCHGATHKSQLDKRRLEIKLLDLREAALAAVILASGVWMVISGLMKLWGE